MSLKKPLKNLLKISRHIAPHHWMRAPETAELFTALQDEDMQALFVGGCVRNTLLNKPVDDMDIATIHPPDTVIQRLEATDIRVIPTGIDHGTVTAVIGDYTYEITTLRRDTEADGRHAVVAYTDCWIEDARRRDFTMNTLLMDLQGNIYDPLGEGLSDLDAHHVRFVGNAAQRIAEDYLRILRFFRFSALYGDGEFDKDGLKACKKAAKHIKTLSRERITQEFFKIIASDKPHNVLKTMFAHDILKTFDFSDENLEFFEHVCAFQTRYKLNALSARLFVFADMNFENIKTMESFIIFPKIFLKDMKAINGALTLPDLSNDHAVRESIYRFGRTMTAQALMIELAQDRVMNAYAPKALEIIQNWDIPTFPVTGDDLMKQGFKEGPDIGAEIKRLEDEWINDGFQEH